MKQKIYFLLVCLLGIMNSHTQNILEVNTICDNEVSTNWLNPSNNSLPEDLDWPFGDPKFLNAINWYPLTSGGGLNDYQLSNMIWSGVPLLEMDNIWSQSLPYYNYISSSPNPTWNNGWELLLVNIGRYPNDVDVVNSNETFQAIPYIVIYNRYSGIIRVFVNFGLDNLVGTGADAVEIILQIVDAQGFNFNGLGRLYKGQDQALDVATNVIEMKALAKATNAQRQWMSADFQIAYDPCICNFASKLQLTFNQIVQENIVLHGRSLSSTDDLIDNDLKINPMTFLSGFDASGNDVEKGGVLIYRGLQNVIDDYIVRYNQYKTKLDLAQQHNEVVDNNLAALKMIKYALTAVLTYGINGQLIDVAPVQAEDWYLKMKAQYGSFILKANQTFDINAILKIAKKVLGSEAKTYIEQNFEKVPLPSAPDKSKLPTVTFTEMHFQGAITLNQPKSGPTFYTPGTYGTEGTKVPNPFTPDPNDLMNPILSTMYNYPVYNDALGTFALLKSPKINVSSKIIENTVTNRTRLIQNSSNQLQNIVYKSWTKEYQFKLSQDIKYALNTVLDIEKHDIKLAYRFKAKNKVIFTNGTEYNTFLNPNYTTNVFSRNQNVDTYDPLRSISGTPFINDVQEGFGFYLPPGQTTFPDEMIYFQTPFVSIDDFYNFKVGIGFTQEYFGSTGFSIFETTQGVDLEFYDIEIVLLVDMEFSTVNTNGEKNQNTQILSYQIKEPSQFYHDISVFDENLHSTFDIDNDNENLKLFSTVFDGSPIHGCILNGNTYTCQVWNDVEIEGMLSVSPGYQVDIIAGNQINVLPESVIDPEIILEIKPLVEGRHPMPQVTQLELENFCDKGNTFYQAKTRSMYENNNFGVNSNYEEKSVVRDIYNFNFQLYPNPTSLSTTVQLNSTELQAVSVEVADITGKVHDVRVDAIGGGRFNLNTSNLAKGIYFVKVTGMGESKTKQLIVN